MNKLTDHRNLLGKDLLLCFDAFGTLFAPKIPVTEQYGEIARRHGLSGFSNDQLKEAFKIAFKEESKERPNYGKAVGMAAPEWWGNIIKKTFQPFLQDAPFPPELIPDLLTRFSSKEGYKLYPDVLPFFDRLRKIKAENNHNRDIWPWRRTTVGVVTNSDDRVPSILTSFGLRVGPRFHPSTNSWQAGHDVDADIDFVVLSYDVGEEKPHPEIFRAARTAARAFSNNGTEEDLVLLYAGDELNKDVVGAVDAGWEAILLDRDHVYKGSEEGVLTRVQRELGNARSEIDVTVVQDINTFGPHLKAIWQEPKTTPPLELQTE